MKGNFLFIAIYVFSKEALADKVEQTIAVSISWYVHSIIPRELQSSDICFATGNKANIHCEVSSSEVLYSDNLHIEFARGKEAG